MSAPSEVADVATPIGTFRVVYEGRKVRTVDVLERGLPAAKVPEDAVRRRAPFPPESPPKQLLEYFQGRRSAFSVEVVSDSVSDFDRAVYRVLSAIPPGETVTYGELARRAGHAGAARAVGGSMHRNPVPIIVPCHRVVGEDGSLTGFGLGLWRKRWLLDREGAWPLKSKSAEGPRGRSQHTLDEPSAEGGAARPGPGTSRATPRARSGVRA